LHDLARLCIRPGCRENRQKMPNGGPLQMRQGVVLSGQTPPAEIAFRNVARIIKR
jgi:hypothetical protein